MAKSNHPAGTFSWFDCGSTDAAKAKAFYTRLFGWNAVEMPGEAGIYTILRAGNEDVAGLYQMSGPKFEGVPSHWMTYVAVDDVDATAKRVGPLGGRIMAEPMDIPDVGRMAVVQDPTGAVIAIARLDQHPGTSLQGPFGWSELATRDTARAQSFYTELFNWTAEPDPQSRYTEFQVGGRSIAGMMEMMPQHGDAPAHWMPYVMVDDCDAIARKATDLGGTSCVPPRDIENVGRFAVFADPAGAVLAVIKMFRR